MALALIIDDVYLKDYTPLGKSVDVDEITPFIDEAQDIYIQDLLGTPLYNDLVNKLYSGITYSTIELSLVELCSKSLAYWTIYMALPSLAIRIRNVGVARAQAEGTQTSTFEEMKYIREEMKNMAEFWATRVVNFICAPGHMVQFPLYNAVSPDMYPSTIQYDSDIYIEDRYKDITSEELRFLRKYLS